MLSRLESHHIQNVSALLSFLDDHHKEISQNSGLFLADEAVLMLRRMRSLGVFDPRVLYLLWDLIVSMNYKSQVSRVKTERANQVHKNTLAALRACLAQSGVDVSETFLIDAYADFSGPNIFEVKSIDDHNEKSQIRHAVAQLYEYRFVYGLKGARLWLVLSGRPETNWILEYLIQDRGIAVLWFEDGGLSGSSMGELTNLLSQIHRQ